MAEPTAGRGDVALFATCLVDLMRPSVGFATARLLEDAGYRVVAPADQTCCGQPAFNSGDRGSAAVVARGVIAAFEPFPFVVAPSGSCAGMIRHYPELFDEGSDWRARAQALADKTWELTAFLTDIAGVSAVSAKYDGVATYHDSCSGLRELGVKRQPRALLRSVEGLEMAPLAEEEVCCGFGGTFCVKYPEISDRMVSNKTAAIAASGADTLLAGDLGCLMNMAGKLSRQGSKIRVRHVAEILAGEEFSGPDAPPPIAAPVSGTE